MYSDNSYKDTPVPMPNTEVKLVNAESTWLEAIWEDRKLLNKEAHHEWWWAFLVSYFSFQAARSYIEMNRLG